MVKKDDIIKDFQDVVQGVTNNRDECIVLYFDKSTTELRHFGTSRGQQFLGKHEEFIHRFMAFCSGTKDLEACLNVTDTASIGPNTGNIQNVSKEEVNPENEPGLSVIDKGKSPGQNTVNTSQEKSNLNPSGTNLILAGHYRRTGDIQTVTSGKQTGFSPERKQPDPIVIKDDPDSVQKDPDSVLNDPDPVQNDPDSVQIDPDPAQNDPISVQNDSGTVQQHDPIVVKDDPDSVQNDPDPVQNDPDPAQNDPDPAQNDPVSVQNDSGPVQQPDPIVIKDDLDSVQSDPDPVLNEPDSVLNYQDSVQNDPDPVLNEPDSVLNDPDPVQNDPDPVQNDPDPVQNDSDSVQIDPNPVKNKSFVMKSDPDPVKCEILPIKSDQDSGESNLLLAPKKVEQDDVQNASNSVHSNVGSIENNRESVQNEPNPVQNDPDPVESEILPIKSDQNSVENNLPVAPKKVDQDDVQNKLNLAHNNIGFIENNRESVQNESSTIPRDPDLVQNKLDPTLNVQNSLPSEQNSEQRKTFIVLRHKSKPFPTMIPVLNSYSALLPNPMQNSGAASKLKPNPAVLPTLTPNSASVQNRTPNSVTVPSLTPNLATVQKLRPYSAVIPNCTPNSATVPNRTSNSATVPSRTPNSTVVPNLTRKPVVVPNLSTNLMTVLKRPPNSTVIPNLKSKSATVPNLIPSCNLANVPNLTSNSATVPNLTSNLASGLGIKGKPSDQKQGHIEKFQEHTSKSGKRKRLLYTEEVKFLPSTVDMNLECPEMKVDSEDDTVQCEEHLDQGQEHMEHLDQGQEHMEHLDQSQEHMEHLDQDQEHIDHKEQGKGHMEHKEQDQEHTEHKEQGQEHMELSREQGQEHKYGEHSGFDSYVDSIWMKPKPNPYHVDHPYAKKSEKQMKIPRKQLDVTKKSGEHIGATGERIKTEDCDMSLLMEVNEIDETRDQKDNKTEKDQTQKIPSGAEKTSSSLRKREVHKPRKQVAEKKGLVKEKRFSLMKVSYEANYEMPDGATLTCLQCNQNFKDLKDLQFHLLKTKHEQVSTTETAFKCFTCLRYFQREWDLQQHMINTLHNGNVKKARKSLYNTKNRVEKVIWTDGSKTYRCFKCNNTYKDFFSAKSHVMRDQCLSKYSIPCQVCDKFFTDKNSHQVHVRTAHKEEFPFRCKNCDKIFYRKNRYARHKEHCIQGIEEIGRSRKAVETCDSENLDAEQICIICRETFINYDQLKAHIVQSGHEQVTTTETINKCFTCNTYFQKYVDLTYHMSLTSHTGNPRLSRKRWVMKSHGAFSCSFCREIFPSVEKCEEHVKEKTCTERWSKKCLFCPKTYFQKNIYEVHIKSEHDYQRPLKCFKCGQEYKQLSAFLEHQEECNHGNDKLPKKEGEIKRENYCAICDRTFNSSIVLKLHKWRVHKESMFKCEICKCKFKRLNQLLFHLKMNKHSSSVSMVRKKKTAANKKSPSSSSMAKTNVKDTTELLSECNVLQKKSKDGQTLYTCGICSRSFGKLDNLTRHQRTNHFRPKSLLCEYCGYETMWISNFRLHVKSVHNMDYDTSLCNICGEEMSKSLLKKHMATHVETQTTQTHVKTQEAAGTRVKTAQLSGKDRRAGKSKEPNVFKCNLCINATFDKNYKYEMHMLRHYGEEGKLPCVMCDSKVAGYTEGMLKHLRRVHHLSYDEAFAIRGNVEPLTLRLGKLMEKYSEKGPPVPDLDYFPSK